MEYKRLQEVIEGQITVSSDLHEYRRKYTFQREILNRTGAGLMKSIVDNFDLDFPLYSQPR
jgi:hypothetical protein